jgi:peptidyl-prolyl cis-trans isomerase SurA
MTHRLKTMTLAMLTLVAGWQVQAQGLRLQSSPAPVPAARAQTQADFIVAIVNSEPVTNNEVRREIQRVMQQMAAQRREPPDPQLLAPEVLETLINHKAQLQLARDTGLRAEESAIDQAEQTIAMQNQFDVAELRRRIVAEGQTVAEFRSQLGEQILIQRLRERILVAVPENASPAQVSERQARAQRAADKVRAGEDFAAVAAEFSDAPEAKTAGGLLGMRPADRYPELFVSATAQLPVGGIAGPVRSGAGFHVLKLADKSTTGIPTLVTQNHVRHILLRTGPQLTESAAAARLADYRRRIVAGQTDFAELAREHSQDGSAKQGGDLGWANPGRYVPEFEQAVNALKPGDISEPLVSRFGVHLIQLVERREAKLTQREQRDMARDTVREKKVEEALTTWMQELRGRAYVEYREAPQ